MTPAARSLQVFGIYLLGLAAVLFLAPNTLLALFGIPPTQDVWIRVLGILVGVLGAYYVVAAVRGLTPLYLATVIGRGVVFVLFIALVLVDLAPAALILFGAVDLLGALWTWKALHGEARA